ncbi:Eco57I restriction-modification methylase domain-containing protein [candidate division KSB1 bacterium]|nr:Eco57I restriction-modification methylase domain-containing protein [candidate division KSB1 bacterium]
MHLDRCDFDRYIKTRDFKRLFAELGWDNVKLHVPIAIEEHLFTLEAVAEKRGFTIFTCSTMTDGEIPHADIRKKIDRQVTKRFFEHIIIFINKDGSWQIWQSSIRAANKPIIVRETHYHAHQSPEILVQKLSGLFFSLDEEDRIGLVDVRQRVSESFNKNTERITRQFYEKFKKHHTAFLNFIDGIQSQVDRDWYASLMLNRLMFIYFIQKKGFLDNDRHYLRNRLQMTREKRGRDQFYSFYRNFLLVLFHQGLGAPHHSQALEKEIGRVPYLNGGLFDEHRLEKDNPALQIKDEAFERLFDFFDEYQWHLDNRISASGRDINPDVIGYIFEKYINDRAEMGAYYTKEDITDYLSKNCIIPRLFDIVKKERAAATGLWQLAQENPDRYMYDAMRHGVRQELPDNWQELSIDERVAAGLPDDIAIGIDTSAPNLLERRASWNRRAPQEIALPTEIYREVIERRKRYWEIYAKLSDGEIADINDFITYNLDIRQFAQDAVAYCESPDFIRAMYKALCRITILDPTCGSGAFLFAALNILEPLYETCLLRMQEFLEAEDQAGGRRYSPFRQVLDEMKKHPNPHYYIYKKIILQNLYGVDIMNEAVEIAKLRLFLKLMAELDDVAQVEPLPDIDFNIRAGNTLVGFATEKELHDAIGATFDFDDMQSILRDKMELVALAFKRYKEVQLSGQDLDHADYKAAKDDLNGRLAELDEELNHYLARQYGVEPAKKREYEGWKASHKPFHWLAEFYEIVHANGGFDVIIGNPPYVEYSNARKIYKVLERNYQTLLSGNLYAFITERSMGIIHRSGKIGLIVPIALVCTQRMEPLIQLIKTKTSSSWISCYAERPSKLFSGAEVLLAISIMHFSNYTKANYITGLRKWISEYRPVLFETIRYNKVYNQIRSYLLPKIDCILELGLIEKVFYNSKSLEYSLKKDSINKIFYRIGGGRYWKIFTNFQPVFILNGQSAVSSRENYLYFEDSASRDIAIAALNSSLFFWYFQLTTNGRDMNPSDLRQFPLNIDSIPDYMKNEIQTMTQKLMSDYKKYKIMKSKVSKKTGHIQYEEFYPRQSKNILDEIDILLGSLYNLSEEELDYIINYDIKYRMGEELESEEVD